MIYITFQKELAQTNFILIGINYRYIGSSLSPIQTAWANLSHPGETAVDCSSSRFPVTGSYYGAVSVAHLSSSINCDPGSGWGIVC